MFEKWALRTDQAGLMGFGRASFNGVLFPLFYLISSLFQIGYPKGWRQIYDIIELVSSYAREGTMGVIFEICVGGIIFCIISLAVILKRYGGKKRVRN